MPGNNFISDSITVFSRLIQRITLHSVPVAGALPQELELKHLRRSVVLRHGIGDVCRTLDAFPRQARPTLYRWPEAA